MVAESSMHARRRTLRVAAVLGLLSLACVAQGNDQARPRTLPAVVQADVNAIAQQLSEVRDADAPLACGKAVDNARYGVETMLEVGEKNLRAGYMTQAAYDGMAPALRSLRAALSLQDCESASGVRRDFYQCMSSDYNHVLACGKAHPFEP